jgi:hypothetical protein
MAYEVPNEFVPGNLIMASEVNENFDYDTDSMQELSNNNFVANARNLIRQLQDRSVVFSADGGEWAEAYTSAGGRESSVDTGDTNALFDTNKYKTNISIDLMTDTLHDPDSFSNPENAGDADMTTSANKSGTTDYNPSIVHLGYMFDERTIAQIRIYATATNGPSSGYSNSVYIKLQTYNGSDWNDVETIASASGGYGSTSCTYNEVYNLEEDVQGIRLELRGIGVYGVAPAFKVYAINEGTMTNSDIIHDIPSGTFSDNVSKVIGVPLAADWEDGSNVQYKVKSSADETDWLDINEVASFTEFTEEPDELIVRLIPSTTAGYPAIYGFGLYEVK